MSGDCFDRFPRSHPDAPTGLASNAHRNEEMFRAPEVGWDLIVNQNVFIERFLPGAILRKLTEQEMNRDREPFLEPKSRKPVWR
jgi:hypothetical protein